MQSSLYSVLLLLALLQTDGNFPDQAKLVEPFLSLIQHCSASRVWMVRRPLFDRADRSDPRSGGGRHDGSGLAVGIRCMR